MKITHHEVECTCKKKNRVVIELTEEEAAILADYFDDCNTVNHSPWPSVRQLAKEIHDLAGMW